MKKTISNMNDLSKVLKPKIKEILDIVAEEVKEEIDDALKDYYDEYNPASGKLLTSHFYERTYQLRNSCKIGKVTSQGNKIQIEVYLDIGSLNYRSKGADPYKTAVAANAGLHGGWDIDNMSGGQVPWNAISNNDGTAYGSGTQIWEEPMQELFDDGKLIALFKKHAKAHGLNIK